MRLEELTRLIGERLDVYMQETDQADLSEHEPFEIARKAILVNRSELDAFQIVQSMWAMSDVHFNFEFCKEIDTLVHKYYVSKE